jgi:exopolysaccharide production protein ExoZ
VARHLDKNYGATGLKTFFQFGHAGVDLFFVLSGFIILLVHYDDIGRPERLSRYAERRLTRIFPTYWVALALTILLGLIGGHALPPVSQMLWSATLLPSQNEPLLGVAWTLQFEMAFYAMFCLLILNHQIGLSAFALWLAWIVIAAFGVGTGGAIPDSLHAIYNLEFFIGMGAAIWFRNLAVPYPRAMFAVGTGLFTLAAIAENLHYLDGQSNLGRLVYGMPAVMIVLGIASAERAGSITVPKILRTLGSASYSIYLFQFVFIAIAWKLWLAFGLDEKTPHIASFPLLAIAALIGGAAASRFIEYPLIDLVRRMQRRGQV